MCPAVDTMLRPARHAPAMGLETTGIQVGATKIVTGQATNARGRLDIFSTR